MPLIEVTTEYDAPFRGHGWCVVYHDGVAVSFHNTFKDAMFWAFPGYNTCENSYDSQTDNWSE